MLSLLTKVSKCSLLSMIVRLQFQNLVSFLIIITTIVMLTQLSYVVMSHRKEEEKSISHRYRDGAKRGKELDSKRIKIINNVNNVSNDFLKEPSL